MGELLKIGGINLKILFCMLFFNRDIVIVRNLFYTVLIGNCSLF